MNRDQAIENLQEVFPDIDGIRPSEELGYSAGGIFLGDCAEGGTIDGVSACNYNAGFSDPEETIWTLGVHNQLASLLHQLGYFAECQDPGTYLAWEI